MASNVLFNRSELNNEEDVWDDELLIKAYNKAIGKVESHINRELKNSEGGDTSDSSKKKKKDKSKKVKKNKKDEISSKWKLGDLCYAVYTEDGIEYEAKIIYIDYARNKCVVRYEYYENEEEKDLDELVEFDNYSETSSTITSSTYTEDAITESHERTDKNKQHKKKNKKKEKDTVAPTLNPIMPPGLYPFPVLPPPPPPPLPSSALLAQFTSGDVDAYKLSQNEMFYSMLMSWYMNGYHTGFYLASIQNQSQSKSNKKNKQKSDRTPKVELDKQLFETN